MDYEKKKMSPNEMVAHNRAQSRKSSQKLRLKQRKHMDDLMKQHEELQKISGKLKADNIRIKEETARLEQINGIMRANVVARAAIARAARQVQACQRKTEAETLRGESQHRVRPQKLQTKLQEGALSYESSAILAILLAQDSFRSRNTPSVAARLPLQAAANVDCGASDFSMALNDIPKSQYAGPLTAMIPSASMSLELLQVAALFPATLPLQAPFSTVQGAPHDAALGRLEHHVPVKSEE